MIVEYWSETYVVLQEKMAGAKLMGSLMASDDAIVESISARLIEARSILSSIALTDASVELRQVCGKLLACLTPWRLCLLHFPVWVAVPCIWLYSWLCCIWIQGIPNGASRIGKYVAICKGKVGWFLSFYTPRIFIFNFYSSKSGRG